MAEILNTDIYNIVDFVNELSKKYTDEDDETLAVGIYGYLNSINAKKIKAAIATNSELFREAFAGKSKFEKNIFIHAIQNDVENITGTPAKVSVLLGIPYDSIVEILDSQENFIFDSDYEYIIGDYPYRLDYNITLSQSISYSNEPIFVASYNMDIINPLSDITTPILNSPIVITVNAEKFVFINTILRQVSKTTVYKKILTSNNIENKTMLAEFEDQLAYFNVKVTDTGTNDVYLTPVIEGGSTDGIEYYCYYTYLDSNTLRIKFDSASYMPDINSQVEVNIYTTQGSAGNFVYTDNLYFSVESTTYGYKNISEMLMLQTNSYGGVNRKSITELTNAIPKKIIEKNSLIMESDIKNYFNDRNTDRFRLDIKKKIHNSNSHLFYAYGLAKNTIGNIVQTTSTDIFIPIEEVLNSKDIKTIDKLEKLYSIINYNIEIDDTSYICPFIININTDPLSCFYYFPIVKTENYVTYTYTNPDTEVQYVANRFNFYRKLNTDVDSNIKSLLTNKFELDMTVAQNITTDLGVSVPNEEDEYDHKIKAFVVFFYNNVAQCYKEATISSYDPDSFTYNFNFEIETDNKMNIENGLRLTNVCPSGSSEETSYYLNIECIARVYILVKFDNEYGRYDLDDYIPNLQGMSVCNVYTAKENINFLYDLSDPVKSDIKAVIDNNELKGFNLTKVPMIGKNVIETDDDNFTNILDFSSNIVKYANYMEDIKLRTENSFEPSLKFYKTIGKSEMYYTDKDYQYPLTSLALKLVFNMNLVNNKDTYLKDIVINLIKSAIEKLSDSREEIHFNNICANIRNEYPDLINYIELESCNGVSTMHIYKDQSSSVFLVPEFISIDNYKDSNGDIKPYITINLV